jgi:hypothetical protein
MPLCDVLVQLCAEAGLPMVAPPQKLCTDNGAMIAWTGIERLRLGLADGLEASARPRWPLDPKSEPRPQQQGVRERRLLRILRRCGRILLLSRSRIRFLGLFIREVMANRTAADGPEDPVVAGIVPGNAADQGAFQTTLGLCGTRRKNRGQREGERDGGHHCGFHCGTPLLQVSSLRLTFVGDASYKFTLR